MEERTVESPEEIADISEGLLIRAAEGNPNPSVGLPGGRSVLPVLEGLRRLPDEILGRYAFYLVDERWERDYNGTMLFEELFQELLRDGRVTRGQIRFPDVTLPLERAAREYADILPDLSIAFLGAGEDGHVASLFPGHAVLQSPGKTAYITDSPKPPPKRLTLTFEALSRASVRVLIFWGVEKAGAYSEFVRTDDWKSTPASFFKRFDTTLVLRDGRIGR